MQIQKIDPSTLNFKNSKNYNKPNWGSITGYSALACGIGSIVAAYNKQHKIHKFLGWVSVISAISHFGIIEYYKHKYKKTSN